MIGIPLGLIYANAGEWLLHKHMLHGLGKDRKNFWSFHWHEHHRESRKHDMFDPQYVRPLLTWSPQGKEAAALVAAGLVHLPLLPVAPFFTLTVYWSAWRYYKVHKRAHLDRRWAKEHVPWHYDHHMGKDQNSNWCVTNPWFDHVMGTRKRYSYDANGKPMDEEVVPKAKGLVARFIKSLFAESKLEPMRSKPRPLEQRPAAA
jgi:sterol desaturase/sphingolipid hydroxylase (fatty acid hydroxylase superfamily)